MYKKLLLNCEGGIIDATQQAEQDNCAVVCIGLGGTGVDCLKNLKAKIYNRVKPDNPDSAVPTYSHIKFLALDTDKTGLEKSNEASSSISRINMSTEFFDISYGGDIGQYFKENSTQLEKKQEYKEWLRYSDIKVLSAKAGAGGVRQLGRFLLLEHASEFLRTVENLVNEAKSGLKEPKTYIHIFSGISGGTGAGTFLDVCYLVQQALANNRTNSFVLGYFFLPDVNIARGLDAQTEAYVKDNGYASLSELDYCMNFEKNGDEWRQSYNGIGEIRRKTPPVDICHLITAKDVKGNVIPGAYDYAMNVVTDYFMDFIVKSSADFTMESHISNYVAKKAQIEKEYGANYEYCVLGASSGTLPFKEVLTYLASSVFEKMADIKKRIPTKIELENFIKQNSLTYDQIYSQLRSGANTTFPAPDYRWQDEKIDDKQTVFYYTDLQAKATGVYETNCSAMKRDLEDYQQKEDIKSNKVRSTITKVYAALKAVALDPDKGPFYAAALLRSTTGISLIDSVNGYIEEAQKKFAQQDCQDAHLYAAFQAAQNDFHQNANFLNGHSKYQTFCAAERSLISSRTLAESHSQMLNLLNTLKKQLTGLADKFMDMFRDTMKELIDTFDENKRYLDKMISEQSDDTSKQSDSSYEIPLVRLKDIKENLDVTLKEIKITEKTKDFLSQMLSEEGIKAWSNQNEGEIFRVVNKYFTTMFSAYSKKTMTSYLQEKYNTTTPAVLVQSIRNDIMNKLDSNANPMFWTSSGYSINNASKIGYITFPTVCTEVKDAAEDLALSKTELKGRPSDISDRISIMRCLVGVPLYGYQGVTLYETPSVASVSVGKHIYEGKTYTNKDGESAVGRDWRYLPSPVSLQLMNDTTSDILEANAKKAEALYEEAEKKGIIAKTSENTYGIRFIKDSFIENVRNIAADAASKTNDVKYDAAEKIKALLANIEYEVEKVEIPNDGSSTLEEGNKRLVRIDHFVSSPCLHNFVKNEIAKKEELEKLLSDTEPKVDETFESFKKALFAGVIKLKLPLIDCSDEYDTQSILSKPGMPYSVAPLFQAFRSYKQLDKDLCKYISDEAEKVLETYPLCDEAKAASMAVWADLANANIMVKNAQTAFPAEVAELKTFLRDLKDSLQAFAAQYYITLN